MPLPDNTEHLLSYDHFLNCFVPWSCSIICTSWSKELWNGSHSLF